MASLTSSDFSLQVLIFGIALLAVFLPCTLWETTLICLATVGLLVCWFLYLMWRYTPSYMTSFHLASLFYGLVITVTFVGTSMMKWNWLIYWYPPLKEHLW